MACHCINLGLCNPSIIDTFGTKDAGETVNMPAIVNLMKINVRGDVCKQHLCLCVHVCEINT